MPAPPQWHKAPVKSNAPFRRTALLPPERKSLQQTPEEDTSKQDGAH